MGEYTIIGGSRALKQVVDAMVAATDYYVHMDELMEKVGERLAELTGAEWGYVASSCTAALMEITAACIAGTDPEKMVRLPDTTGMKNEVVIQKAHRITYDWAVRMAGARIVEVVSRTDMRAAINPRTAMITIIGDKEAESTIPLEEMIAMAREHDIPCLVDAAAQRLTVPNRYLKMGAGAVVYSGGKCLRGPQSSGLVLGRRDLLKAAYLNAAPHHSLGRPMKVGKEEVMGLLAAVEAWFLGRDHELEWSMWEGFLRRICSAISDLPSIRTTLERPGIASVTPRLNISWDEEVLHCSPDQIHHELREGDPAIVVRLFPKRLQIVPIMMEEGDDEIVSTRLRALLTNRTRSKQSVEESASPADVRGDWIVHIQCVLGSSKHSMILEQNGSHVDGVYKTPYCSTSIAGTTAGNSVELLVVIAYQSHQIRYVFSGKVSNEKLSGEVSFEDLAYSYGERVYATAKWTAKRAK